MAVRPRRGAWQVDVAVGAVRVRRQLASYEAALQLDALLRSTTGNPAASTASLRAVLDAYLRTLRVCRRPNTLRTAAFHVEALVAQLGAVSRPNELAQAHLDSFIESRRRAGWSTASINGSLRILRAALNHAARDGRIARPAPPVSLLRETRRLPSILTEDEVERLLRVAAADARLAILLAAHAGLRHVEILHLKIGDIDLGACTLAVRAKTRQRDGVSWTPKDHDERGIPLSPALAAALLPAVTRGPCDAWLFPGVEPSRPRVSLAAPIRQAFRAASLNDPARRPGLHQLRRTWASRLLASGADVETVRELGGWSDLLVVQRYVCSASAQKRRAIATAFGETQARRQV